MLLEVSVGEAVDKFSILEIKLKRITDEYKKNEIAKELHKLNECKSYIDKYLFYYNLLIYVNEKIWDLTNTIKITDVSSEDFSIISKNIFDYNQKRFRIKNWLNILNSSEINEQKSYNLTYCKVCIQEREQIYDKIAEINFLLLEYDIIVFDTPYMDTINQLFKVPTYKHVNELELSVSPSSFYNINIVDFELSFELSHFEFPFISYISGGAFGDFIQQISVINENFYKTGQKGILYLSRKEHHFFGGFDYTYNDTYTLIKQQRYIHDYKIHENEPFDFNLSVWRTRPDIFLNGNWYNTFKQIYNVEWGKHKWINTVIDEKYKDIILINTTDYRWPTNINFTDYNHDSSKILFICSDKKQYDFFINKTLLQIEILLINSFNDLCIAINSCKLFIGSQSGPLAIAHATHTDRICGNSPNSCEIPFLNGLNEIWNNIRV